MTERLPRLNTQQRTFVDLYVGTLIYCVVLGVFNDYTSIVEAKSFSTIIFASALLELLTFLAFKLKASIVNYFKNRTGSFSKFMMFFAVWLVMFLSKFVFIWAIDSVFGDNMNINGFFGILIIVICVTIIQQATYKTFLKLGDQSLSE